MGSFRTVHTRVGHNKGMHAQKVITSHTDQYLVSLPSKTNVFEDKLTKY